MRESKNMKHFKIIKKDSEIIKLISEDVIHANTPVFSSYEVGMLHNFNPRENPALGEEFFSMPDPTKKRRFQLFNRFADI
jgi:hypothetical protein